MLNSINNNYPGFTWLICLILTLTCVGSNYAAERAEERFSNFYTAPANLELIAMPSDENESKYQYHQPPPHPNDQPSPSSDDSSNNNKDQPLPLSSSSPSGQADSDEPRFSIGLGTLAPSYSQKFGLDGKTTLDFDNHANGFSYTLTNHHHPQSPEPSSYSDNIKDDYSGQSSKMNFKIYHDQLYTPKPLSTLSTETKSFISASLPPAPFNFSPRSLSLTSKTSNFPSESRFRELVEKYAPKDTGGDDEDGLEAFFPKGFSIGPKGSWNPESSEDNGPLSFDDMPDFPGPNFDHQSEHHRETPPSSTPPPPPPPPPPASHHYSGPRQSRNHSPSPSKEYPRQGRYYSDQSDPHSHHDIHSHSEPRPPTHSRSHPLPHSHSHSNSHPHPHSDHLHSHPESHSHSHSPSRSRSNPPPYSHSHPPSYSRSTHPRYHSDSRSTTTPSRPHDHSYPSSKHNSLPHISHHSSGHHSSEGSPRKGFYYGPEPHGFDHESRSTEDELSHIEPFLGLSSSFGNNNDQGPSIGPSHVTGPIQFNNIIHHGGSNSVGLDFTKDSLITGSSGPRGFEYINRITSSPADELNSYTFGSGSFDPKVFSVNNDQGQLQSFDGQQNDFAAYITGLPLAP